MNLGDAVCADDTNGGDSVQQSQVSSSEPGPSILASNVIGPLLLEVRLLSLSLSLSLWRQRLLIACGACELVSYLCKMHCCQFSVTSVSTLKRILAKTKSALVEKRSVICWNLFDFGSQNTEGTAWTKHPLSV